MNWLKAGPLGSPVPVGKSSPALQLHCKWDCTTCGLCCALQVLNDLETAKTN